MGNVSSQLGDATATAYLRDTARFSVAGVTVTSSRNRPLLSITPCDQTATRFIAKREGPEDIPVEYVLDPESAAAGGPPSFLLRLSNEEDLIFTFTLVIRQESSPNAASKATGAAQTQKANTVVTGLTFLQAPSIRELDNLITKELHADPNLHKNNANVHLIGDYSTSGNAAIQFQWTWKWRPPKVSEDRGGGWRNCCSFVEYNQRNHRLDPLAVFSFWVQNTTRSISSPKSPSPRLEVLGPARLRVPSAQSMDSRVSDFDWIPDTKDIPPASPLIEAIPEDGLGLINSVSVNTPLDPVKLDVAMTKPGEDVSAVEDGPLFRATMKSMEQRTGSMKQRWKRVLRRAEDAVECQKSNNTAIEGLIGALREASSSNANAIQPAMEHYFDKIAKEILIYERQNAANLQKLIIDPIARLYNVDIKQAESKKRDFEEESKEYYAYVSRYLGKRQDSLKESKRNDSDTKYQKKKRDFELKRFDYSSFMQDLHGGRKDQEVLSNLTRYADTQARSYLATAKKIEEMQPQLEALIAGVNMADKEFQLHRTEREEKRRALEKSVSIAPSSGMGAQPSTSASQANSIERRSSVHVRNVINAANNSLAPSVPSMSSSAPQSTLAEPLPSVLSTSPGDKFKGIRDLQERDYSSAALDSKVGQQGKEGLVWAMSRPGSHADPKGLNKQAWHKYWIVLDQGKLAEYKGWKEKLDLHMDPIDLRVASVRESRSADRRFCFEIITPQFTRVYQAQGEEDMRSWINYINNAMQNAVEGKGLADSQPRNSSTSINKDLAQVLTGKSASTGHRSSYSGNKGVGRHATVGDRPGSRAQHFEISESSSRLLKQIRDHDQGNQFCADCGSDSRVDWVSINLGIVICIECSGIHRSLGTHISKVRSLTLDLYAFNVDVIELLLRIGNRVSNMIWEGTLPATQKPTPTATRDQRHRFITAKYAERAYVQPLQKSTAHFPTPDETLLASIKKNDIQNALYALALKADPNVHDRSRNTHAVFLALVTADPLPPTSTSPSPAQSPNPQFSPTPSHPAAARKPFAVAELLVQNGAEPPSTPPAIPLSPGAKAYLREKMEMKHGRRPNAMPTLAGPDSLDYPSTATPTAPSTFTPTAAASHGLGIATAAAGGVGIGDAAGDVTALPFFQARVPDRERVEERRRKGVSAGRLVKMPPTPGS